VTSPDSGQAMPLLVIKGLIDDNGLWKLSDDAMGRNWIENEK